MPMTRRIGSLLLFIVILPVGCGQTQSNNSQPTSTHKQSQQREVATNQKQKEFASEATDALFARLSTRLTSVISEDGPAMAISVCSKEAPEIAREVSEEFGVSIGRTSFKLRNSKNLPPDWATSLVESRIDKPQYVDLPDGGLGALLPIVLQPKCVTCHGPQEALADDVRMALKERYHDDQATGFQAGDLRGWFWVEVPEGPEKQTNPPERSSRRLQRPRNRRRR